MRVVLEKRQAACRFEKRVAEPPSLGISRDFVHINSDPIPSVDTFILPFNFLRAFAFPLSSYSRARDWIFFFLGISLEGLSSLLFSSFFFALATLVCLWMGEGG